MKTKKQVEKKPASIITYANHGGSEAAALFVKRDGWHRIWVRRIGVNQLVSISRCSIILNPDKV